VELYLLDEQAQRIAIVPEYESLTWRTGLMSSSADVKLPVSCFAEVAKASYLERSDRDTILFIAGKRVVDRVGEQGCYISAYDPVELLRRRVLFRSHYFAHSRAEVVRRLVSAGLANVADMPGQNRAIDLFVATVGSLRTGIHLNEQLLCQMSWGSVYEHIETVLEGLPVRFFSRFDAANRRIAPVLYEGRNLAEHRDVVLSARYGDLSDVEYSFESIDRKDTAIVAGQGEGASRPVTHARLPFKVPYGELWVDADNIGSEDSEGRPRNPLPDLQARGIEKLQAQPCEHALTASLNQGRFQYGVDYQVGDRVGYEAFEEAEIFEQTPSDIVSEVEEVFEGQSSRTNVTIGTTYPTIRKIVERN